MRYNYECLQERQSENERCVSTEGDGWISPVSMTTFQSGGSEQLSVAIAKLCHTNHFFSSLIRPEAQPSNSLLVLNVPWSEHQAFVTSFPSRTHSVKTFKSKFLSFVGTLINVFCPANTSQQLMSHSNYFLYNWSWLKADKWCWCFSMAQSILLNVTHGVKLLHRIDSESNWRCFFYSICVEPYFLLLPPNFSTGISKASSLSHTVFVGCFNLRHLSFPWACTFFL